MALAWLLAPLAATFLPPALPIQSQPSSGVTIAETFAEETHFDVSSSVNLTAKTLAPLPSNKTKAFDAISAVGSTRYHERIVDAGDGQSVLRVIRRYLGAAIDKKTREGPQRLVIRPAVERIVVQRANEQSTIFSADGPLTAAELDLFQADTFCPALAGLLAGKSVRVGDQWDATPEASAELTGIRPIQSGGVRCTLREVKDSPGGPQARVTFTGSLAGPSEEGPSRQTLDGFYVFDVRGGYLAQLLLNARNEILGAEGQVIGELEGRHELRRKLAGPDPRLAPAALSGLDLKPSAKNTSLLFEGTQLGIRVVYPRNWELISLSKNQLKFTEPTGGNLRLTIDETPPPTSEKLRRDLLRWLESHRATVQSAGEVGPLEPARAGRAERFTVQAVFDKKETDWHYVLVHQDNRSATLAASLIASRSPVLRRDIDTVAAQIQFLPKPRQ